MKLQDLKEIITPIATLAILGALVFFGCKGCDAMEKHDRQLQHDANEDCRRKNDYSFRHPEIVGTNEHGQLIKRYIVYGPSRDHVIYQLENTDTTIKDNGKFGIDIDAINRTK